MWMVLCGNFCKHQVAIFFYVPISLKKISFNIVGHGMDLIVEVLLPCLQTLLICTFMTMNLMMKRPMKSTLKNYGLLICASLWDWMIPPPMWKKIEITPTFKFIHLHRKNICSNGWHNARNHQWSQRRWGSTHRPHHIIIACYCNKCTRYSPFQGEWSHASCHGISLCQWWTW